MAHGAVVLAGADSETTRLGNSTVLSSQRSARVHGDRLHVEVGSGRHEFSWNTPTEPHADVPPARASWQGLSELRPKQRLSDE